MAPSGERTLCGVLGIEVKATKGEIKSAYYRQAFERHPDKNHGTREAIEDFQELVNAYKILSNDDERALYDNGVAKEHPPPCTDTKNKTSAVQGPCYTLPVYYSKTGEPRKGHKGTESAQWKGKEREAHNHANAEAEAESKRYKRGRQEEAAMDTEAARVRAAEKAKREEDAEAREAEKLEKAQEDRERAADHTKSTTAEAEQEWTQMIEEMIRSILTIESILQKLEGIFIVDGAGKCPHHERRTCNGRKT